MELFEAIDKRHSYRGGFTDKNVPRDDLERIVQAGIQAPSGCNEQTTTFVIIDDPKTISEISEILDKQVVHEAKAIIAVVADYRPSYKGMTFAVEDYAAAVENMLLAITALGYATVWTDGALRWDHRAEKISTILRIPEGLELRVVLPIGEPKDHWTQREKKPFEERAWFNGYRALHLPKK